MREQLRIMSLSRWVYALSYFITQGIFALFTGAVLFVCFFTCYNWPDGSDTNVHEKNAR